MRAHLLLPLIYLFSCQPMLALATADFHRQETQQGQFILTTEQGEQQAPLVATHFHVQVTGMVSRVTLEQTFTNPTSAWVEGIYVFPLAADAVVDHLTLHIGTREIAAVIQPKDVAQRTYASAKQRGAKAGLVEQQRPNLFTTHVTNLGPGESLRVRLEYQQTVHYHDGQFSLRIPTAITPRYHPEPALPPSPIDSARGVNAQHSNPPVNANATPVNPIHINLQLNLGFTTQLHSPYHQIRVDNVAPGVYRARLTGVAYADRDFQLQWSAPTDTLVHSALFTERQGDARYHLVMVTPPQHATAAAVLQRALILVVDVSGSMHGAALEQAKASLTVALHGLTPNDRFNIIAFNDQATALFPASRRATPNNRRTALDYVDQLHADGGTEMAPAFNLALTQPQHEHWLRQVIFITDGAVGNERQLFQQIQTQLGDSRLFTVGIGSAPNAFFMRKAAEYGRGTFTFIAQPQEVQHKMQRLLEKLRAPVFTDITLQWGQAAVEMWPQRIPDLYLGQPLLVIAKTHADLQTVTVTGRIGAQHHRMTLANPGDQMAAGLGVLWAGRKIADLTQQAYEATDATGVTAYRNAITALALTHHVVSQYTSLVAVDTASNRPDGAPLTSRKIPVNLPQGFDQTRIFAYPQTATSARLYLLLGLLGLLLTLGIQQWRRC